MIYLDHNATTPLLPEVRAAMEPFLSSNWGNPSSAHSFGLSAKKAVEVARRQVAKLVGADASELIFTGSATEANNMAVLSALEKTKKKPRIVTSATEHSSILNLCASLSKRDVEVAVVPVLSSGVVNLSQLDKAITADTTIVSVMWANNETGVVHPIESITAICADRNVMFHCDAVQAAGKVAIDLSELAIDYLTLSGHKMFAPKGAGALVARRGAPLSPLIQGGHQEKGLRGGTENVPAIVGFGKASELALGEMDRRCKHNVELRDELESRLLNEVRGAYVNGNSVLRLPNTTNLGFQGIDSETLVALLDQQEIYVSSGSACLSESVTPSHVVLAMTGSYERAGEAVRFSFSHLNTRAEIGNVVEAMKNVLQKAITLGS